MNFGLQDNLDKLFHSGDVGDYSQSLTADFLIIDLDHKVHQTMHQLALDSLILRVGHEQFPIVEQYIGHTAQYARNQFLFYTNKVHSTFKCSISYPAIP